VTAINLAAEHLIHAAPSCKNIAILTDSLPTAFALESNNTSDNSINILKDRLLKLTQNSRVVIQWIPAHCGIPGNDKADLLAKDGSQQQQESPSTSHNEAKMLLKQAHRKTWQRKRGEHGRDTLLHLSTKEATTIFCLRTGHCRLRAHLKWMNQMESARCACQEADQTPEHVLLDCPLWMTQRYLAWPEGATLAKQLWGSADDLKRTVNFIENVGINVRYVNCRKSNANKKKKKRQYHFLGYFSHLAKGIFILISYARRIFFLWHHLCGCMGKPVTWSKCKILSLLFISTENV
jgi:hypothetical protein